MNYRIPLITTSVCLILGTTACGGGTADVDTSNPTEVKEAFEQRIEQDLEVISQKLEEVREEKDLEDGTSNFFHAESVGTYSFDIQETDSIVTPYVGQVEYDIIWHSDIAPDPELGLEGGKNEQDMLLRAEYAFQDGEWIVKDAYRVSLNELVGVGEPLREGSAGSSWALGLFEKP